MKTKTFMPGNKIKVQTKSRAWEGYALESHDSEIILLKLSSGYNIGIRENEILDAKILEKMAARGIPSKMGTNVPSLSAAANSIPSRVGTNVPSLSGKKKSGLPNVVIIITGGTISSRLDPKSGGVIPTDKEAILNIAPEIRDICNPIIVSPFMKFSEDMDPRDWKKIAEVCEKYLNDKSVSGIIVTHGTDTLHYTSAALSFFIKKLNKPIALTYSQRSIDRASTDAALNLICAAKYAISDIAEVALVGHKDINDDICLAMPGTNVLKLNSSQRNAFKTVNDIPIAKITKDKIEILREFNARDNSKIAKLDTKLENKVTLIKIHPGQDPSILEYYEQQGYKGIIIEATGLGHVPGKASMANWIPKIKKAIQNGMIICATPQTIYGRLNPNVYSSGRNLQKTGIIFLEEMLSTTALIKLSWALGHKTWAKDKNKIREVMLHTYSREISKCLTL